MDEVTQQNAALVEEAAAAAESLVEQASNLMDTVGNFKLVNDKHKNSNNPVLTKPIKQQNSVLPSNRRAINSRMRIG